MTNTFSCRIQYLDDSNPFATSNFPEPTRPLTYAFLTSVPLSNQIAHVHTALNAPLKIEDCALQIYKQNGSETEYGSYLDLEQSLDEQPEEFDQIKENKRSTILLRTQLSVRVHTCVEKILNSKDGELRRSLFLLKQLFQNDKDLVHEFVNKDGLECLVKVANDTKEHNYINYILRALGQLMLFVDGMNGVIRSNETVQWLYSVLSSGFRLVMKTSLKLLIVFVEYAESNAILLIQAVNTVDSNRKSKPWCNIMQILRDLSNQDDLELILYSMILINTVLNSIPDQDTFYDVSDAFEEQAMQSIIQHYFRNPVREDTTGNFKQIIQQMELYEAALLQEDGDEELNSSFSSNSTTSSNNQINKSPNSSSITNNSSSQVGNNSLAPNLRKLPRTKSILLDRKGRRHSIDLTNIKKTLFNNSSLIQNCSISLRTRPLISLIHANANAESISNEFTDEQQNMIEQQQKECSSPKSVKSFISMQQKAFEKNTSQKLQHQSEHGDLKSCAQTDLSNAFAQLLLRRNTFSTPKSHQNKPFQENKQGFGFNHLSDRSQSIAKLNCSSIGLQNQFNKQPQQNYQVVPNVPVSKLKAKFEVKLENECKKFIKQIGNPILFSSPKLDKKGSPILSSLKFDLGNDEEETINDSLSTIIPNSTVFECENFCNSNNETLKTSLRNEKDIIDLDTTLNDSFLLKTDLDDLNDSESYLFNIELDECPTTASHSSSSSLSLVGNETGIINPKELNKKTPRIKTEKARTSKRFNQQNTPIEQLTTDSITTALSQTKLSNGQASSTPNSTAIVDASLDERLEKKRRERELLKQKIPQVVTLSPGAGTNERRTNRWSNENTSTSQPTYKSNANLNLANIPTSPPLSPTATTPLSPNKSPTSPSIISPVGAKLLNNRGNQRWETANTNNNSNTSQKQSQNTSSNILESSHQRRKQRIERHKLLTLQQYDLNMKNLIINNVNDLKNTLKQKNKVINTMKSYDANNNDLNEENSNNDSYNENMSDNENVYADDDYFNNENSQEFSYIITSESINNNNNNNNNNIKSKKLTDNEMENNLLVIKESKEDDLLDEEDTYIVESFEQTYSIVDIMNNGDETVQNCQINDIKKENVKVFKTTTSMADSIEKSFGSVPYQISNNNSNNSDNLINHESNNAANTSNITIKIDDASSMRSLSSMSGISSQGIGGSNSSNTSSSSSLNNGVLGVGGGGLLIGRGAVRETESGIMSISRSQASSSSVSPPSHSSLSSDLYYSNMSYTKPNNATAINTTISSSSNNNNNNNTLQSNQLQPKANSNISTIQQQQQQLPRRVLSNLANNNLNNNEDACRVPNSTVNSLSSTVGSATASVHNNNSSPSAVVPISNGKLYSSSDSNTQNNQTSVNAQQNEAHTQSKIQKIKEQVNNSVANADYARTEMEQVQRPLSIQSIQRQISSSVATSGANQATTSQKENETITTSVGANKKLESLSGIVSRAKEGLQQTQQIQPKPLAASIAKPDQTSLNKMDSLDLNIDTAQIANKILTRPLVIKDLDFTDLTQQDDADITVNRSLVPPPPPPPMMMMGGPPPPPPMMMMGGGPPPPPPMMGGPPPPPPMMGTLKTNTSMLSLNNNASLNGSNSNLSKNGNEADDHDKRKLTKLHWKEAFLVPAHSHHQEKAAEESIWSNLVPLEIDKEKLAHLFELKQSEVKTKKAGEGKKEITILDAKRSNMIMIGMTALPPPRVIKTAIIKMDSTIITKEGIEKLLTMLPTDEEKQKILEAQMANPDIPLGSAEFFLLNLSSISEIKARLELWLFKLDFESVEGEIAEHLMDLKLGMDELKRSKTFKDIIRVLREIGNFLNSCDTKGFQLDYLSRVPEVKDTVHKHSLLQHLCSIILEKCKDTTDLYADLGGFSRCSKADWDEISRKIKKLETDCQASWENLRAIAKHDSSTFLRNKLSDFLADCAERIQVLKLVHDRLINRFRKFLVYLGYSQSQAMDYKVKEFCKLISEFALEYKTVRDRLLQQQEKRANHRERHKTRGKMITDNGRFGQKLEQDFGNDLTTNGSSNGYYKTSNGYGNQNKAEDNGMMEIILKNPGSENKLSNGNYGSTSNIPTAAGGLPGVRGRTRQSISGVSGTTGGGNNLLNVSGGHGKTFTTDTEEDETVDFLLKSAMTVPKGQPPKKRTKKYGERKSFRRTRNINEEDPEAV